MSGKKVNLTHERLQREQTEQREEVRERHARVKEALAHLQECEECRELAALGLKETAEMMRDEQHLATYMLRLQTGGVDLVLPGMKPGVAPPGTGRR